MTTKIYIFCNIMTCNLQTCTSVSQKHAASTLKDIGIYTHTSGLKEESSPSEMMVAIYIYIYIYETTWFRDKKRRKFQIMANFKTL
jgi:hypothetical protein